MASNSIIEEKTKLAYHRAKHYFTWSKTPITLSRFTSYSKLEIKYLRRAFRTLSQQGLIAPVGKDYGANLYLKTDKLVKRVRFTSGEEEIISNIDQKMTFGVELEFGSKYTGSQISQMLKELPLHHTIFGDGTYISKDKEIDYLKNWIFVSDGSINIDNYPNKLEIASPILKTKADLYQLKILMSFLKELEGVGLIKQNYTCGGHVHHGGFNFTVRKLIDFWETNQHNFDKLVNKYRAYSESRINWYFEKGFVTKEGLSYNSSEIDCYYCSPVDKTKYFKKVGGKKVFNWDADRYLNLNISTFKKHGDIEVRQLEGTLHFKKLLAWIALTQLCIRSASGPVLENRVKRDINEFFEFVGANKALKKYYESKF